MPCKITREQADQIKSLYATGKYKQAELAVMFSISRPAVSLISNGRNWDINRCGKKGKRWHDNQTTGFCRRCGKQQGITEFEEIKVNNKMYRRRLCKACVNEAHRAMAGPFTPQCEVCRERTLSNQRTICVACEKLRNKSMREEAKERARLYKLEAARIREDNRAEKIRIKRSKIRDGRRINRAIWKLAAMKRLGNKCALCNFESTIPSVFDFHHIDPGEKLETPARCRTEAEYVVEIAKCDMLCVRCHRITHWIMNHPDHNDNKGVI